MLSTEKYIDSFRAFTDLQKPIHGILVWELTTLRKSQSQGVYGQMCMETKLNVKAEQTRILTLNYHYRKAQSKAGRWYRMHRGNQKVARSEAEHERRGVTAGAQWQLAVPLVHICHPHFTDEESRFSEVTRSEAESRQVAKLGEPAGKHHIYTSSKWDRLNWYSHNGTLPLY